MAKLKSGESMPIKISGASTERYSLSSFLKVSSSEIFISGSKIPMTDIFFISKKESRPSCCIFLPPTPMKEEEGKIRLRSLIREAPS